MKPRSSVGQMDALTIGTSFISLDIVFICLNCSSNLRASVVDWDASVLGTEQTAENIPASEFTDEA